jgi:peptidoglycan-N-acetylglucosamine deacetylase
MSHPDSEKRKKIWWDEQNSVSENRKADKTPTADNIDKKEKKKTDDFRLNEATKKRMTRNAIILGMCLLALIGAAVYTVRGQMEYRKSKEIYINRKNQEKSVYWKEAEVEVDKEIMTKLNSVGGGLGIDDNKVIVRGDPDRKYVALTFDDGPHPKFTPKILSVLKQYGAKATFFVVGEMAEKYPKLVKAEYDAGNSVGNHTYHHVNSNLVTERDFAVELKACENVVKSITGAPTHLFRPPGGNFNRGLDNVLATEDYVLVLWTENTGDYNEPGAKVITEKILDKAENGSVILVHDGVQETIYALPIILQRLKARGFEFVTIDEMLRQ